MKGVFSCVKWTEQKLNTQISWRQHRAKFGPDENFPLYGNHRHYYTNRTQPMTKEGCSCSLKFLAAPLLKWPHTQWGQDLLDLSSSLNTSLPERLRVRALRGGCIDREEVGEGEDGEKTISWSCS